MDSNDEGITSPVEGGGFFRRLFKFRATYRPDEPRMSRLWWAVFMFLPPLALALIWPDKKFLKQMALVIFYVSILMTLPYTFGMAYISSIYGPGMPWGVVLPVVAYGLVGMPSGLLITIYAQYTIIKTEERIWDGAVRNTMSERRHHQFMVLIIFLGCLPLFFWFSECVAPLS